MHKGVQGSKPLPQNKVAQSFDSTNQRAGEPIDEQLRISYGTIVDVNTEKNTILIDLFGHDNRKIRVGATDRNKKGVYVPIIQPLPIIHLLYGALRKGLIVRVFWKGKHEPGREVVAEVISDDEVAQFLSGRQEPRSNELTTSPHEIFTGGVNV